MDLTMQIVKRLLVDEDNKDLSKNFIISPLSLTSLLTMVASGHKGEAFEKLMSLLGLKSMADLIYESNRLMSLSTSEINGNPRSVIFSSVNGVWVDKKYKLKPSFEQVVNFIFKSHSSTLDFENKVEEAAEEINKWGEKATRGLIKESFPKEYVKRNDIIIVLANALYFKAAWSLPFDPYVTFTGEFHTLRGDTVQVPYMHQSCTPCSYGSYLGSKILRLPYRRNYNRGGAQMGYDYAMYFFLPDEKGGLHHLLGQFSSDSALINLRLELKEIYIGKLVIPKFKFKYGFEVTEIMEKMGVVIDVKDSEMLEVEGIISENIKTFHSCCIEVDEHGTEAAAASLCLRGGGGPPPGEFVADRPFVFMIREDSSQTPVFLGTVVNPLLD